jgi:type IV fimbrial biogenesis protein FimT
MKTTQPRASQQGFTLVELMVTISVMVILLAVAVPSLHRFTVRNQLAVARDDIASAIGLARMEAVRQGAPALLTAVGSSLADGWQICPDLDNDGVCDNGVPAVRQYPPPPTDVVVTGNKSLSFGALGVPATTATFTVCPSFGGSGYAVQLNASGTVDVDAYAGCP